MTTFEKMILMKIPADYSWSDVGVVRIGANHDVAAFTTGGFRGPCLIFCHGNAETAVSERYWFDKLAEAGVSVICPDYRGYGLSAGELSEWGCYEAAHAAYDWLVNEKNVPADHITVLGYSLGSAIAVELAVTETLSSLILQAPFLSGAALRPVWEKQREIPPSNEPETAFPTEERLPHVTVPTLVIHGTKDTLVPFVQGESVYSAITCETKEMLPVEGAGHCDFQYHLGDEYVKTLTRFIQWHDGQSCEDDTFDAEEAMYLESCSLESDEFKRSMSSVMNRMKWHRFVSRVRDFCRLFIVGLAAVAILAVIAGVIWLCEFCGTSVMLGLKDTLLIRTLLLVPWLMLLVVHEVKTGRLPNKLTMGCLLTGVGVSIFAGGITIGQSIAGALVGGMIFIPLFLLRSCGAGEVKLFAAVMSFWGIKMLPFVFLSALCIAPVISCLRGLIPCLFKSAGANRIPSSPVVLLTVLSTIAAVAFGKECGMIGGYVFIVATVLVAVCVRWLFPGKPSSPLKQKPSSDMNTMIDDATQTDPTTPSDGSTPRNPLPGLIVKGEMEVRGFRLKKPLLPSSQCTLLNAECVEEGYLGLRAGTPVILKFIEESDALPPFSDLQEAISCLQNVNSRHVVKYYGCLQAAFDINGEKKLYRVVVMEPLDGADLNYRIFVRSPMFYADEIM